MNVAELLEHVGRDLARRSARQVAIALVGELGGALADAVAVEPWSVASQVLHRHGFDVWLGPDVESLTRTAATVAALRSPARVAPVLAELEASGCQVSAWLVRRAAGLG